MNGWLSKVQENITSDTAKYAVAIIFGSAATLWKFILKPHRQSEERRSPDRNVTQKRTDKSIQWRVNPFWIEITNGRPAIRTFESRELQNRGLSLDQMLSLYDNRPTKPNYIEPHVIDQAKANFRWLLFNEFPNDQILYLDNVGEPASADDRHLFQPLPPESTPNRFHNLLNLFRR